jgi:hypothetical protein
MKRVVLGSAHPQTGVELNNLASTLCAGDKVSVFVCVCVCVFVLCVCE